MKGGWAKTLNDFIPIITCVKKVTIQCIIFVFIFQCLQGVDPIHIVNTEWDATNGGGKGEKNK